MQPSASGSLIREARAKRVPNYRIVGEVDPSRATRGTREVENSLDRVERRAQAVNIALTRAFAFIGVGGGLIGAIGLLKDFEQQMSTIKGITGASEAQFRSLREEAQRLGATTRFSASQAAEGMTFLARAGFNTEQVLGATEGTLRLAQAGALDLGRAADIASNILTGFGLEVDQTGRVVDVLALASNSANTDVSQLGEAMKFVAPVAAGLGVELETATAAVGALSDAGLQASLAGTGLRRVLAELESPAVKTQKILAGLGVTAEEVKVSKVGLIAALERLAEAGVDTGLALEIFGDRGGPAFEVLSTALPKVRNMDAALRDAEGTATRLADTMDDNLNGSILATISAAEGLILAFGESGATGSIRGFFDLLTTLLRAGAANIETLMNVATGLTIVFGARLAASALASASAMTANAAATTLASQAAIALTLSTTRLGAALAANTVTARAASVAITGLAIATTGLAAAGRALLAFFGGPIGLAITAVTVAIYGLWTEADRANDILGNLKQTSRDAVNDLLDLEQKAREAGINVDSLGNAANDTNPLIRTIAASYGTAADQAQRLAINAREAAIAVAQGKIAELQAKRDSLMRPVDDNRGRRGLFRQFTSGFDQYGQELFGGPTVEQRIIGASRIEAEIDLYRRQIALLRKMPDEAFKPPAPRAPPGEGGGAGNLSGGGAGGGGGPASRGRDDITALAQFNQQLLHNIELAGLSGSALMKRQAQLQLQAQMGRELNAVERETLEQRLDQLAAAQDLAKITEFVEGMERETELLGLGNREREIAAARIQVETQLRRDLDEAEAKLIETRAIALQQARDADVLEQYAERLNAENDALADLLPGREARVEVLRLELQLGRALDPVEKARIINLVEESEALRDQREVYDSLNRARETTIRQLEAIAALVASGAISDSDARIAVMGTSTAQQLADQSGQLGGDFAFQAALDQIELWTLEQNRIVEDGLAARLISEQEAADRSVAIEQERQRRLRDLITAQRVATVQAAGSIADSLAMIAKDSLGEQSKIYRAMFVASKAFAIAESIIKIQQGIANAMSLPFPANFAAAAAVAAQAASIVSNIKAVSLQFAEGGLVRGPGSGTSDSITAQLSNGEYVVNARATAQHLGLLEAINSGMGVSGGLMNRPARSAPATAGGGSAGAPALNVTIENYSSASMAVERIGPNDVRIIAREEARQVLAEDLADTFAAEMSKPNSRAKEAVIANTDARPAR